MRVSFSNNSISFGYNRNLNKQLIQRLNSHPDQKYAGVLLNLNDTCNKCEDVIRELETKKKKSDEEIELEQNCLDIFYTSKEVLASFVSLDFSDLNYANRECQHYKYEIEHNGNKKSDWRHDACRVLADWVTNPGLIPKQVREAIERDRLKKLSNTSAQANDPSQGQTPYREETDVSDYMPTDETNSTPETETDKKEKDKTGLIKLFTPTADSPKGFSDVVGMESLKADLQDSIITYINHPEQAVIDKEEYGKTAPKAILLYGPPGCGKTYITQAMAEEVQKPLLMLNISQVGSHYINKTSKNLQQAFNQAKLVAEQSGHTCFLFMDEIDTIGFDRSAQTDNEDLKQVGTLLQAIDDAKKCDNLIIIGATNKFKLLDPALKDRFEAKTLVDIPDEKSIKALLQKLLKPMTKGQKLLSADDDLEEIAKWLYGYSNRSIVSINQKAALNAMRRDRADISIEDYKKAIEESDDEKPNREEYLSDGKKSKRKLGFQA